MSYLGAQDLAAATGMSVFGARHVCELPRSKLKPYLYPTAYMYIHIYIYNEHTNILLNRKSPPHSLGLRVWEQTMWLAAQSAETSKFMTYTMNTSYRHKAQDQRTQTNRGPEKRAKEHCLLPSAVRTGVRMYTGLLL